MIINHNITKSYLPVLGLTFLFLCIPLFGTAQVKLPEEKDKKYLFIIRRTVDSLLANAQDIYGKEHSKMILSILDCRNANPITKEALYFSQDSKFNFNTVTYSDGNFLPKPPYGVRKGDRTGLGGSNSNLQQDLYRAMEALGRITGEEKYVAASHDAMKDFFKITQHPETGLLAWGEHLYWNCFEDRLGDDLDAYKTHEPKRKFIYFDYLYSVDPTRTLKYARGLWDHQIADKTTGDFSRHAKYHIHRPGNGFDFPKEGSCFIDTWSRAYKKTKDPEFSRAVKVLANRYLNRTNNLGLLDWDTSGQPERANRCITLWLMSLASEADDAQTRMDKEASRILKKVVVSQDKGFLSLAHDVENPEKGFVCYAYTDTGKPMPIKEKGSEGYSHLWGLGYGIYSTSMFGLLANTRQEQLRKGKEAEAYRKLVLQAARIYQSNPPDPVKDDIWSGEYGMVILLQIAAYRLTEEQSFLTTAQTLADDAIKVFWKNGEYAVPKASSHTDYYDCISYSDTLILALLALHEHAAGVPALVKISDINR
jgi:hypothetical protein